MRKTHWLRENGLAISTITLLPFQKHFERLTALYPSLSFERLALLLATSLRQHILKTHITQIRENIS